MSDETKKMLSDRKRPTVQVPVGVPGVFRRAIGITSIVCSLLIVLAVAVALFRAYHAAPRRQAPGVSGLGNDISTASASRVEAERACLEYAARPEQVVYEEVPERVKKYVGERGEWIDLSHAANRCGIPAAGRMPACLSTLTRVQNTVPAGPAAAIVFLHERRTPRGRRELVAVTYDGSMRLPWPTAGGWTISSIGLSASIKLPEALDTPPTAWHGKARRLDADPFVAMYPLRLYAGQPDPVDPTHFTIRYELDDDPASTARRTGTSTALDGTIDGWLLDPLTAATDQPGGAFGDEPHDDVVKFTVRDGQARLTREQIWSPEEILRDHREQGLREGKRSWGVWTGDEPASSGR